MISILLTITLIIGIVLIMLLLFVLGKLNWLENRQVFISSIAITVFAVSQLLLFYRQILRSWADISLYKKKGLV